MAEPLLSVLLQNLNTLIQKGFGLPWGVEKDMKKLESALSAIQAVLDDAEEKQLRDRAIRDWLRKLRHAAYELEGILDDCSTEVLKWEYKRLSSGSLEKVATLLIYPVERIIFRHKIGTRMKAITEELDAIADEQFKYHLQATQPKHAELAKSRETSSLLSESLLLGRDEDKEKIIEVLVQDVCDREDLSVYPIVGMGGIGKTTLAQMVFNDDRVKSHFEPRIWVYVSQDFDSKRLIKTAIQSVTGDACETLDLNSLNRKLRGLLHGKRYLIALDDVWNEDQEKWHNLKSALACGAKGASLIVTTRLAKVAAITGTVPPHHLSSLSDDDSWLLFKQQAFGHENEERPNLVTIGKEIVKKCKGVPLAAKALGGLLRFKSEKKDWLFVKESAIRNLLHDENSILKSREQFELAESRESSSILTESLLLGRDGDKENIIKVLVEDVCDSKDLSVYPIVAMGGLGKTALAQMVFNDDRVKSHFEPRIWLYASQDFNPKRLIKTTIQSVSGEACETLDLDSLNRKLRGLLNGKRYLIALDDVWNDNQEEWHNLKSALACGAKGASLIVTTRLAKVAAIMGTVPPHYLSFLSDNDCWLLFKQQAFGHENEERPNLVTIGKEIVKKCKGVPLAAKALGGLLRFKSEEKDWLFVKENEIWNLPPHESSIWPALRLSYNNLPVELRQCFAYCAIFPQGSRIGKEDLIHHWMANGYVSGKDGLELEDIGEDICNELCWRSLFQVVDSDEIKEIPEYTQIDYEMHEIGCKTWFKMHDLVHDLARSVMEDEYRIMGTKNSSATSNKGVRCVSSSMLQQENHKACFPFRRGKSNFKKFGSLRVVHGGGGGMSNLPSSIGNLKHLRYLDISRADIKQLPDSICSLWNLQTLILDYCKQLERLPKNMNYLRGLRHLYLTECPLSNMPPKIGQLTCLKTLSLFVVGKSMKCSQLAELQRLNLGGKLCIEHLERVRIPTDAKEANLVGKKNLCLLKLSWGSIAESESQENVEEVLEALEPHPNLKELIINNYGGTRLPLWRGNSILENIDIVVIEVIELINCKNCFQLPPLGQLPLLRRLKIEEMDKVEYIDGDFCCEGPVRGFPSLEKLEISRLPSLKGLSREEGRELLPRLREIEVCDCPKLRFPCLSSPKVLKVDGGCTNVVLNSISNLNSLTSLDVTDNEEVICFPIELLRNLTLLESLRIWGFSKLKMFPDELARLVALKSLDIGNCIELESLPVEGLRGLESLQELRIQDCCKLSSLSEGLGHLTSLERLEIRSCRELVAFPEGVKHLNSLRDLTLEGGGMFDSDVKSVPLLEGIQHIPALESLRISNYYEITSLPHWLGNLTSLQSLHIWFCRKIASLPASIQGLTKLNELDIAYCSPELEKRCQRGTGEDWDKIAHVPRVRINEHLR